MDTIERYEMVENVTMRFPKQGAVSKGNSDSWGDEGQADSIKLNRNLGVAPEKEKNKTTRDDNDNSQEFADIITR